MNKQSFNSPIAEKILGKIKGEQIRMRPKLHFILKTFSVVLGIVIVALFVLYLISFVTFTMRATGVWYLTPFGFPGVKAAFMLLPWLLIFLGIVLVIILEVLVKHFTFSYRRPVFFSLIVIIVIVLLGSFVVERTGIHPDLFQRAREGRLSVVGGMYRGFGMPKSNNVHRGIITEIREEGFLIQTSRDEILNVVVASDIRFPFEGEMKIGDKVVILGGCECGTIKAVGVRQFQDNLDIVPCPPGPMCPRK